MAKKPPKDTRYLFIKEVRPWIWRTCDVCKCRLAYEKIWRHRTCLNIYGTFTKYACKECCSTRKDFQDHIDGPRQEASAKLMEVYMNYEDNKRYVPEIKVEVVKPPPLKIPAKRSRFEGLTEE